MPNTIYEGRATRYVIIEKSKARCPPTTNTWLTIITLTYNEQDNTSTGGPHG